jgi:26S proteasome regulatory subunit T2
MGQGNPGAPGQGGPGGGGPPDQKKDKDQEKKKWEHRPPTRTGRRRRRRGAQGANRLPQIFPTAKCKLRLLKHERVKDFLLMEEEFIRNQEVFKPHEEKDQEERDKMEELRGSPLAVGSLEEMIDDNHAIVSSSVGPEYYVSVLSFVNQDLLEPGASVLMHNKVMAIVGILGDDTDPMVSVMKVEKAPLESYADIGGLDTQIQEIKEAVELPLARPELYEEVGIKPPKGVILYGEVRAPRARRARAAAPRARARVPARARHALPGRLPRPRSQPGTGKTLLAKAVANQTSATFLRVVGSELIQKYLGDGPKLVRELFRVADDLSPTIVFIDEIDAVGSKRYDSSSGGTREIQRTMLELLNQLDGFDERGDVKVIMATNKIESLDPALIRPGRIDRKIEFPLPDIKTKRHIFQIHTSRMSLGEDVDLEHFVMAKDELSGADIKAVCTEAGLLALRERRMKVTQDDFTKAKEKALYRKKGNIPEGLYL